MTNAHWYTGRDGIIVRSRNGPNITEPISLGAIRDARFGQTEMKRIAVLRDKCMSI